MSAILDSFSALSEEMEMHRWYKSHCCFADVAVDTKNLYFKNGDKGLRLASTWLWSIITRDCWSPTCRTRRLQRRNGSVHTDDSKGMPQTEQYRYRMSRKCDGCRYQRWVVDVVSCRASILHAVTRWQMQVYQRWVVDVVSCRASISNAVGRWQMQVYQLWVMDVVSCRASI